MSNNAGGDAVGTYGAAFAPAADCAAPPAPTTTVAPTPINAPPVATATSLPATPIPTSAPAPAGVPSQQAPGCVYTIDGAHVNAIEAERFNLAQGRLAAVVDAQQSGGGYLSVVGEGRRRDPGTYATYNLVVANGGTFTLWLRGYGPDGSSDSFYIQFDNGKTALATVTQRHWGWKRLSSTFKLSDGPHTLMLKHHEHGANADQLLLTRDREYAPAGLGDPAQAAVCS